MVPSFDSSSMTLEQAADFVAMQAEVGSALSGQEKQAMGHPLAGALIGGGLGAGVGMMRSMGDDEESQRNWWRNALMGGALGAGVGGLAGAGYDLMGAASGSNPKVDEMIQRIKDRANKAQPVNDPVWDAIRQTYSAVNPNKLDMTPGEETWLKSQGVNTEELRSSIAPQAINTTGEYIGRPATVIGGGVGGAGLGHLVDRARAPGRIGGLDGKQLDMLGAAKPDAVAFQKAITPQTEVHAPLFGTPTVQQRNPPAWLKNKPPALATMSSHLRSEMMNKFAPRTGKLVGAAGGTLLAPFFARMFRD